MKNPYRFRTLWHRAMILFYFSEPERQQKHIEELEKFVGLTDHINRDAV